MTQFRGSQFGGGGARPRDSSQQHHGGGVSYGRGGRDRSQPDDTVANHWPDYLKEGYFDAEGSLKTEYVSSSIPGDDKQRGVEELIRAMTLAHPKLTTGQLRRFFQHCRGLETSLKSGMANWHHLRSRFEFLSAAAADAYGKSPSKIPGLFYDFIRRNVAAVKTERDFRSGFLPHFEALVGFGSLYVDKERN